MKNKGDGGMGGGWKKAQVSSARKRGNSRGASRAYIKNAHGIFLISLRTPCINNTSPTNHRTPPRNLMNSLARSKRKPLHVLAVDPHTTCMCIWTYTTFYEGIFKRDREKKKKKTKKVQQGEIERLYDDV